MESINFKDKFKLIQKAWSPKIIASMNNYHFKLAKFDGEFTWHSHQNTDEVFIVIKGEMKINFRDKSIKVKEGEMIVVPKGVEHKPVAEKECNVLLIEPEGTLNTGEEENEYTVDNLEWI
jgi:mannose-6-phosphate isomerase-like protein (cupin superfamily)